MPQPSRCALGSCNLLLSIRMLQVVAAFFLPTLYHTLLLCRVMMGGGDGTAGSGLGFAWWYLYPKTGDTDHRTAEGFQDSVTGAITSEMLILAWCFPI